MALGGTGVGRLTPSGRHQAPFAGAGPARVGPSAKRPPATQCGPSARIEDTTAKSSAAVRTPPMIIIFIFCSLRIVLFGFAAHVAQRNCRLEPWRGVAVVHCCCPDMASTDGQKRPVTGA